MKEYEVVHEIFNECANNQMRDVFFEEVALDDPEQYIRSRHKDRELKIEREDLEDGTIVYHVRLPGSRRNIPSRRSEGKKKRPCSLDFLREWRTLTNPPSVMNEIRICRSYKYYHIREICPNYGNVLKEL